MAEDNRAPWGNAIPLGLSGYCLMCVLLGLIFGLRAVPPESMLVLPIACIAIATVLFTGGLITLRNGDTLNGALLATFGIMFVFGPGLEIAANLAGLFKLPMAVFGAWHLLLGVWMIIWGIPLSKAPIFAFLISPLMVIGLWCLAFSMLFPQAAILSVIAGWVFLVPSLAWGLYAMAVNLSAEMGINLPVGPPLIRAKD